MDKIIKEALKEDIGSGDITSDLLIRDQKARAILLAKENGIFCGRDIARQIFKAYRISNTIIAKDGQKIHRGQVLAKFSGSSRNILKIERTLLNFLQRLSGIATLTSEFAQAVKPHKTRILDTRKTTPGLRLLEKYAVACGGGNNHRIGLYDMILVKDNHLKLVDSWKLIVDRLKKKPKKMKVEIEADTLMQVKEILKARIADIILLDNMSVTILKKTIKYIRQTSPHTLIEISGGVTIKNVKQYAKLGVDRISIGALTHSAPALDISLEIVR
ncbi:MAG: carboxylating nicotinate-nucleotide diphosphorylase [bacterium]|nr:carboxylating nicotinate-nucleotide diphosphorylase [bacterium]